MSNGSDQKFVRACAKFILGESSGIKLRGSSERITATREVLRASRDLFEALQGGLTLSVVKPLIERKRIAAEKFRRAIGLAWRL